VEYETKVVGVAGLAKGLLDQLGVAAAIDQAVWSQPAIGTSYGKLAEVLILNRLTFEPQPLYHLARWAEQHGIDRLLGIEAAWLDDDRLGALLEAVARRPITIQAMRHYPVSLDWLRADTTSIYFEGAYEDAQGQPKGGQAAGIPRLVVGYNKDGKPRKVQVVRTWRRCARRGWSRPTPCCSGTASCAPKRRC
jgi:hypothetical protein